MRNDWNARLSFECLMHAAHSRQMWMAGARNGIKPCWDHYRGWLMDARDLRLGKKFGGKGSNGVPFTYGGNND